MVALNLGIRLQMENVSQNRATASVAPTKYIVLTLWNIQFFFYGNVTA
jgi:hypothetical protein